MIQSFEYDPILNKSVTKFIIEIPAGKCAWAANHSGGCMMCGFNGRYSLKSKFTMRGKPWPNFLTKAFIHFQMRKVLFQTATILAVFNGGSFLNSNEVPIEIQKYIARLCVSNRNISRLFIESRCEFVTDKNLSIILDILGEKQLEIAIGLESKDDHIRNNILNKGLNLGTYEDAIATIHRNNAYAFTYVFLKPPFITERLAIEECIKTIQYAFDVGSDVVSISCGSVQKGSVLYDKWKQGNYRPPWLWSIAEIIKETHSIGFVRIGTFEDEPMPIDFPRNCGQCDNNINRYLDSFRESHDLLYISQCENHNCRCKNEWSLES